MFLIDTNVISEVRKGKRCNPHVARWFASAQNGQLYLSVLVLGEARAGIERIRLNDPNTAATLERWLDEVRDGFRGRIFPIDEAVADAWGRLNRQQPVPALDGLLAATAMVHGLVLVTRNVRHVARTGVPYLNPFEP